MTLVKCCVHKLIAAGRTKRHAARRAEPPRRPAPAAVNRSGGYFHRRLFPLYTVTVTLSLALNQSHQTQPQAYVKQYGGHTQVPVGRTWPMTRSINILLVIIKMKKQRTLLGLTPFSLAIANGNGYGVAVRSIIDHVV